VRDDIVKISGDGTGVHFCGKDLTLLTLALMVSRIRFILDRLDDGGNRRCISTRPAGHVPYERITIRQSKPILQRLYIYKEN
jgi:hypothetical protein